MTTVERLRTAGARVGNGGEGGIRTREAVLPPTRFPVALLRPLGHLSARLEDSGREARGPAVLRRPISAIVALLDNADVRIDTPSLGTLIVPSGHLVHACVPDENRKSDMWRVVEVSLSLQYSGV